MASGEDVPERDEFESGYHYFAMALRVLAKSAPEQCEVMGNYNVAWELKHDLSRGAYLLNYPSSTPLTSEQRDGILDLMTALDAVPTTELPAGAAVEDNLAAMRHPAWAPLRRKAKRLLLLLQPATTANKQYFDDKAREPFTRTAAEVALYLEHALNGPLLRQDWEPFICIAIEGSPEMEAVRVECSLLDQFGGTGSGEMISLTEGARLKVEQLLKRVKSKL